MAQRELLLSTVKLCFLPMYICLFPLHVFALCYFGDPLDTHPHQTVSHQTGSGVPGSDACVFMLLELAFLLASIFVRCLLQLLPDACDLLASWSSPPALPCSCHLRCSDGVLGFFDVLLEWMAVVVWGKWCGDGPGAQLPYGCGTFIESLSH